MLRKFRTAVEFGGNRRVFDHFDTISRRHIKEDDSHLNICKRGITIFAKVLAMQYPKAHIDYAEFSDEEGKLLKEILRIQSEISTEGNETKALTEYNSISMFLTLHDSCSNEVGDELKNVKTKFKGLYGLLRKNGHIFVVDYNFKPWIYKLEKPKKVFKRGFGVRNEKDALKNEPDCFERHTWLSLDMIIEAAQDSGFETRHAEAYTLPYPKFCFYIGRK